MDIFEKLKARGLTRSLRDYSTTFLNRAPNFACLHRGRPLPVAAALDLYRSLMDAGCVDLAAEVAVELFGRRAGRSRGARRAP